MNRMRHYHLGCGEPLKSGWHELRQLQRNTPADGEKNKGKHLAGTRSGKRH